MSTINLETTINAPLSRVFDLSRSIDFHQLSVKHLKEKAIGGRMHGLINQGETVIWRMYVLGIKFIIQSKISSMKAPYFFEDYQLSGPFKCFKHQHYFTEENGKTIMKDEFSFKSPFGKIGQFVDHVYMKDFIAKILLRRNILIKQYAENEDKWMQVLNIY